jgi:hypothetical protein
MEGGAAGVPLLLQGWPCHGRLSAATQRSMRKEAAAVHAPMPTRPCASLPCTSTLATQTRKYAPAARGPRPFSSHTPRRPCHLVQGAVNDLRQAASSEQSSAGGRLDAAAARLMQTLDPTYQPTPLSSPAGAPAGAGAGASARLEALELLTATLQGATLLAAAQQAQQGKQPGRQQQQQPPPPPQQQQQQQQGGGGTEEEMEDPAAAELSRALRALAALLELPRPARGGWPSAAALAADLRAALGAALAQLPPGFFEPLLPRGSLSAEQVGRLPFGGQRAWGAWSTVRLSACVRTRYCAGKVWSVGACGTARWVISGQLPAPGDRWSYPCSGGRAVCTLEGCWCVCRAIVVSSSGWSLRGTCCCSFSAL